MPPRTPPNIERMISLKVGNIGYYTTLVDLKHTFGKYGEVADIYLPRDKYTMHAKGFAFVRYYDKNDAYDALRRMDGKMLNGRELKVQMARYGRPSPHGHRRRLRSRSTSCRRRYRSRSSSKSSSVSYKKSRSRSARSGRRSRSYTPYYKRYSYRSNTPSPRRRRRSNSSFSSSS